MSSRSVEQGARPFQCSFCGSKFKQIHELQVHISNHEDSERLPKRPRVSRPRTAPRAMQACRACAASKTKCDNERQCKRCRRRGTECVRPMDAADLSDEDGDDSREDVGADGDATLTGEGRHGSANLAPCDTPQSGQQQAGGAIDATSGEVRRAIDNQKPPTAAEASEYGPTPVAPTVVFGSSDGGTTLGNGSFENTWDLGLFHSQFDFNPGHDDNSPGEFLFSRQGIIPHYEEEPVVTAVSSDIAISPLVAREKSQRLTDAFRRVTGRWVPARRNFQEEQEENLSAAQGATISEEDSFGALNGSQLLPDGFPLAVRDRLLVMLVSVSERKDKPAIPAAFPSCEALAKLAKSFLAWHANQDDTWIHLPTFRLEEASVDLVAAIVAGGALRSPNRAVQKFGLAVHELMSVWIWQTARISNILTRDLKFLQAYMLQIQIGLWFGDKRKMEQAGGALGNIVNMLRGGGRYRRSTYTHISPYLGEDNTCLEDRWQAWVEQESFKRLAHHIYIHGGEEALLTSVCGPLSSSEMSLPLPASRSLWMARSPKAWQDAIVSQHGGNHTDTSLVGCLRDVSRLGSLPPCYDGSIARLAVVHGVFSTIRSYQHSYSEAIKTDSSNTREGVVLQDSQHRWLLKTLENLQAQQRSHSSNFQPSVAALLAVELACLHAHVSVDQLELLVGKEGFTEAQAAFSLLQTHWVQSREARQALWHAGQILRLVRGLPVDTMSDFVSICVYHVGLCFWSYGTIVKRMGVDGMAGGTEIPLSAEPSVVIDQEETLETQKWIALGNGRPVVGGCKSVGRRFPVSLGSTEALMQLCIMTVRSRFPFRVTLPPASENFCHFLEALGSAGA